MRLTLFILMTLMSASLGYNTAVHAQNGYASTYGVVNYADTTGSPADFKDNGFYIIYHKEDGVTVSDSTIVCPTASGKDPVSGTIHDVTYTKIDANTDLAINNGGVSADAACTSGMTDMSNLFSGKETFNKDISHCDVSKVTDIERMFSSAKAFNQDIGAWDDGSVQEMSYMFDGASAFNCLATTCSHTLTVLAPTTPHI